MWRRYRFSVLVMCASLILLGTTPKETSAQNGTTAYAAVSRPIADLNDVRALIVRPQVAPRVEDIEGPKQITAGEEAVFRAASNIDVVSLPIKLQWDFGDGSRATGLHTVHRYTEPGTYTVRFTISNAAGEDTGTMEVRVVPSSSQEAESQDEEHGRAAERRSLTFRFHQ